MTASATPAGLRLNSVGHYVPETMIPEIDLLRDSLVVEKMQAAQKLSAALREFKASLFADLYAFVDLSAEKYGAKIGGKKGNITLTSYDGRFKIQLAVADRLTFDERLQAARALINECAQEWADGSRDEVKALIEGVFDTDKEGRISASKVLSLRRYKIEEPKWLEAMQAIADSLTVVGSKEYVRFYERVGQSDQYRAIVLDLAAV